VKVSIDAARPDDAAAIAELRNRVADDMTRQFGQGPWSAQGSKPQVLRQMRASRMLVARHEGEAIGTVRLAVPNSHAFDASAFTTVTSSLYVLGLAVSSEHRKRGVGRKLVEHAKQIARDRGAQALWLDVFDHPAGAGPFYQRCGFRVVGPAPSASLPLTFFEHSLVEGTNYFGM